LQACAFAPVQVRRTVLPAFAPLAGQLDSRCCAPSKYTLNKGHSAQETLRLECLPRLLLFLPQSLAFNQADGLNCIVG
jgi:hypothetical protein